MNDKELIDFASDFRDGILDGRPSNWMCAAISWPLRGLLSMHGVKSKIEEVDLGALNHVFLVLEDGRVLDATADQFSMFPKYSEMPPVYLGERLEIHEGT